MLSAKSWFYGIERDYLSRFYDDDGILQWALGIVIAMDFYSHCSILDRTQEYIDMHSMNTFEWHENLLVFFQA